MRFDLAKSILASYLPQLVTLEENLTAAVFPLMKIYPADFCIRRAVQQGLVERDTLVIESSSGTMALGLAIVCNCYGYKLAIVSDSACDQDLRRRLEDLGARVEIVTKAAEPGGYQRARLDRLHEIRSTARDSWWVNQYDNESNPGAYAAFASQLVESLGRIDCLVGAIGSGGSVCGTAAGLRKLFPEMKVIGVDTPGSVLFGQEDKPRILRGLGNSLLPKNLNHSAFDEVHWVTGAEAYTATRLLHRQTTLFCGGTSGACWLVARYWALRHPRSRVVCIFPDQGHRYIRSIYDDEYLLQHNLWLAELPEGPAEVMSPRSASDSWSYLTWGRRSYQRVVGESSVSFAATF